MVIRINSIMKNPSLCDGPGYRTVVFLQGCTLHCPGCHNKATWALDKGQEVKTKELARILREKSFNKKITISGGEPLLQEIALLELFEELKDFDICLYTGREIEDVPPSILKYLRFIKTGPFIKELRSSLIPYVGSTNQKFKEVYHHEESK